MAVSSQNFISLFAGAGGLDLALGIALPDARCVCYVERETEAAEILAARFADEALDDAPVWSDVTTFDGKPWRGLVDGIAGGFPCQDLSVAGKRAGIQRGNRSGLFYEYARIIREVDPRWVYIENVPAMLAFPAGGIVLGELAALGFDAEWGTLRASDVGASHQRKRCWVLAYRRGGRPPQLHRLVGEERHGAVDRLKELDDAELGHADDARRRHLAGERGDERAAGAAGSDMGFVFAPGPAAEIWNDVLVRDYGLRPALSPAEAESCLRRVADGLASPLDQRIDRLRACGNGVVALQGAAAFRELVRRVKAQVEMDGERGLR